MAREIEVVIDEGVEEYVREVAEYSRSWLEGLITTQECYDKMNNASIRFLNVMLVITVVERGRD